MFGNAGLLFVKTAGMIVEAGADALSKAIVNAVASAQAPFIVCDGNSCVSGPWRSDTLYVGMGPRPDGHYNKIGVRTADGVDYYSIPEELADATQSTLEEKARELRGVINELNNSRAQSSDPEFQKAMRSSMERYANVLRDVEGQLKAPPTANKLLTPSAFATALPVRGGKGAVADTFNDGRAFDSADGAIYQSAYSTSSLLGIPGRGSLQDLLLEPSRVKPIFGHQEEFNQGRYIGFAWGQANKAVFIYGSLQGLAGMVGGGGASGGGAIAAVAGLSLEAIVSGGIVATFTASGILSVHGEIADILDGHACAEAAGAEGAGAGEGSVRRITNEKHHPNSASPEPKNAQELFDRSLVDKEGVRWARGSDGTIHRFTKPRNGESHWNGSNAGPKPISMNDIPAHIRRLFR